jgi:glycosyltransferase involved in cell wall biosynthesis
VFDHHDLCPETFESRFPDGSPALYRGLRFLERRTMRTADHVISTNESYQRLVMDRDGVKPARATVVRTGPDPDKLKAAEAVPSLRRGRPYLAAYIGVMGPQDGVDIVLKMAHFVVSTLKRTDISFTLIGSGDCFGGLVALRDQLGLGDFVEFTGRAPDEEVRDILSTADIGLSPDPKNPLNDVSTMNKTMEYMAFGLPVLAFDLRETRASAEEAGVYATPNDVEEMGRLLVGLIDDEPRRQVLGAAGRRRIEQQLAWNHQEPRYLSVFDRLLGREPARRRADASHAA